jgi:hypothetical protein
MPGWPFHRNTLGYDATKAIYGRALENAMSEQPDRTLSSAEVEIERWAFGKWAAEEWPNSRPPDAAWIGWKGRAAESRPALSGDEDLAWLREVDAGTDNACWVVCAKGDPGGIPVYSATALAQARLAERKACEKVVHGKYQEALEQSRKSTAKGEVLFGRPQIIIAAIEAAIRARKETPNV